MSEDLQDSTDHKDVKLSYAIFPKDATAKEIYEYLIARAEEVEKAGGDESGETTGGGHFLDDPEPCEEGTCSRRRLPPWSDQKCLNSISYAPGTRTGLRAERGLRRNSPYAGLS